MSGAERTVQCGRYRANVNAIASCRRPLAQTRVAPIAPVDEKRLKGILISYYISASRERAGKITQLECDRDDMICMNFMNLHQTCTVDLLRVIGRRLDSGSCRIILSAN